MKQNARQLWQRVGLRCLILAVLIPLLGFGLPRFWQLFAPFIVAIIIALPLQRPVRWLERRLHFKRWIAVLLLLFIVYIVIGLFIYWFMSFVVTQAIAALQNAPQWIESLSSLYRGLRGWLAAQFENASDLNRLDSVIKQAITQLSSLASSLAGSLVNSTVNTALSIPGMVIFANFLILGSYFITRDFPMLSQRWFRTEPGSPTGRLKDSALQAVGGYLRMQLLYTLIVLIVSAVSFSIFRIPYAFVIAFIAALLEFLPLFGNGTLYVPLMIILYLVHETRIATIILIVHAFLYIGRKVSEPRVMNQQMGLSPILSLVAMYIGMRVAGVWGLTLSPIAAVVLMAAFQDGLFTGTISDFRDGILWIRQKLGPSGNNEEKKKTTENPEKAEIKKSLDKSGQVS